MGTCETIVTTLGSLRRGEIPRQTKLCRTSDCKLLTYAEGHTFSDSRSSLGPKQDKLIENCAYTHPNQTAEKQRWRRESWKSSRGTPQTLASTEPSSSGTREAWRRILNVWKEGSVASGPAWCAQVSSGSPDCREGSPGRSVVTLVTGTSWPAERWGIRIHLGEGQQQGSGCSGRRETPTRGALEDSSAWCSSGSSSLSSYHLYQEVRGLRTPLPAQAPQAAPGTQQEAHLTETVAEPCLLGTHGGGQEMEKTPESPLCVPAPISQRSGRGYPASGIRSCIRPRPLLQSGVVTHL